MKTPRIVMKKGNEQVYKSDLLLDLSDVENPNLKAFVDNQYKEVNGAASVSVTVTDPKTGEPTTVTGLANVLNALVDMASTPTRVPPTIIQVDSDGGIPSPTSSQKAEIKAAIEAGKEVQLFFEDEFLVPILLYDYSVDGSVVYIECRTGSGSNAEISLV